MNSKYIENLCVCVKKIYILFREYYMNIQNSFVNDFIRSILNMILFFSINSTLINSIIYLYDFMRFSAIY